MASINYIQSNIPPRPYMTKKDAKAMASKLASLYEIPDAILSNSENMQKPPIEDAEYEIIEPDQLPEKS